MLIQRCSIHPNNGLSSIPAPTHLIWTSIWFWTFFTCQCEGGRKAQGKHSTVAKAFTLSAISWATANQRRGAWPCARAAWQREMRQCKLARCSVVTSNIFLISYYELVQVIWRNAVSSELDGCRARKMLLWVTSVTVILCYIYWYTFSKHDDGSGTLRRVFAEAADAACGFYERTTWVPFNALIIKSYNNCHVCSIPHRLNFG
jgi:hypothetical protein